MEATGPSSRVGANSNVVYLIQPASSSDNTKTGSSRFHSINVADLEVSLLSPIVTDLIIVL